MNGSFETPAGIWLAKSELGIPGFGQAANNNAREPSTPSVSSPTTSANGKNGNPLSNPMLPVANGPSPAPPLMTSRLSAAQFKAAVTPGKSSKSRDPSTDPANVLHELYINGSLTSPTDELSALPSSPIDTPVKRRGLVSLNSFQSIPLVPSFNQKDASSGDMSLPRPKANLKTSSSAFVLRVENVPSSQSQGMKALTNIANQAPTHLIYNGQVLISLTFWTQHKSLLWCDASTHSHPLPANQCRVSFSIPPSCVCVNQETASQSSLDVVIGFPTGDLFWLDPICGKYSRINKSGVITSSPVTSIAWLPLSMTSSTSNGPLSNSGLCFASAHADGGIFFWSTEKDDPQPLPSSAPTTINPFSHLDPYSELSDVYILPLNTINPDEKKKDKAQQLGKINPVVGWKVCRKSITDMSFANEGNILAVTCEDGKLRVIDCAAQRILDTYSSYFGALTTVCWSPDSRLILTGGQDDLISIFSHAERHLIARCQGHASYVAKIAFELPKEGELSSSADWRSRAAPTFASVGDDGRLLLWDLSGATLHRPKNQITQSQRRSSLGSTLSLHTTLSRKRTLDSQAHLPLDDHKVYGLYHEAPSMKEIAALQPVSSALISNDLLTGLAFIPQGLIVVTRNGLAKVWQRPGPWADTTAGNPIGRGRSMQ